ncbi:hypothetical protein IFT73_04420 [Aeromicrobium sp. CFBP 8757]|uniref:hypothetical protein n=1 Tax=Aeromicrobium sp. CFBP 8757 TaxID=2775288 RepID=UPI00177A93CD|nr:hypothetical protein [Aeromicrobium sp. CFBP 8757]MBD8606090.1 hypothetical protein [Aeromicrobium sp. CFBP 8757]
MATDFTSIGKYDQGALISGGLALILSFIPSYYTASYDGPGGISVSDGTNAWTSYATLGVLLIIAATAVVAVKAFARENLPAGVPWNLVAAALAGVGTLLVILRAIFDNAPNFPGVSSGPGWSGYLLFLAGIALTVFTVLSFRASGEKLPQANKNNNNGGTTPPAAPPAA